MRLWIHVNSIVVILWWTLCSKLNDVSASQMQSCHLISTTKYVVGLSTFFHPREYDTTQNSLSVTKPALIPIPWWRHQMETFSALLAICAGNSPVTGEFTSQRPVTRSFDFSLICALNKRLNKQSWGWWFEAPSRSLWRHCNATGERNKGAVRRYNVVVTGQRLQG